MGGSANRRSEHVLTEALNAGFTPFIIGGIVKAAAGAAVVGGLWEAMGSGDVSRS